MKKLMSKAFTLIELLIVIAIIGILAVTVLLAINPAEAQKKGRDAKRVKDTTTLQAAFEQYLDSGSTLPSDAGTVGGPTGATSATLSGSPVTGTVGQPCGPGAAGAPVHWLGEVDFCPYVKTIPLDPSNSQTRQVVGPTTTAQLTAYRARINGSNYEIDVRQESESNASKVTGDGGDADEWFEVFSGDTSANSTIAGN